MLPIQDTCQPRPDILQGSFNPEIFTASLSQVMDHYHGKPAATHVLYTDAEAFFRQATYPTEGLRMLLTDVLSRLASDHSAPALYREQNFDTTSAERDQALVTTVSQTYNRVWFPSAAGQLVDHEIKTAGGEG